jgi:hypothetical protein
LKTKETNNIKNVSDGFVVLSYQYDFFMTNSLVCNELDEIRPGFKVEAGTVECGNKPSCFGKFLIFKNDNATSQCIQDLQAEKAWPCDFIGESGGGSEGIREGLNIIEWQAFFGFPAKDFCVDKGCVYTHGIVVEPGPDRPYDIVMY